MSAFQADMFALIVTDGVALEYPPELYLRRARAELEAERWAWILSGSGWLEIERPLEDRWVVGDRDVRLVPVGVEPTQAGEYWVAQYWTRDGALDPEAVVVSGREAAIEWVLQPPPGVEPPSETVDMPWFVAATYPIRGEDSYAIASLAKLIG